MGGESPILKSGEPLFRTFMAKGVEFGLHQSFSNPISTIGKANLTQTRRDLVVQKCPGKGEMVVGDGVDEGVRVAEQRGREELLSGVDMSFSPFSIISSLSIISGCICPLFRRFDRSHSPRIISPWLLFLQLMQYRLWT